MRRERILEVAFKKFSEKGYNASLSEIAKEAGIRKQTLYNYFESKDDLFLEMVKIETKTYFLQKRAEFSELTDSNTEERLYKMFMLIMKYYEDKQKLRFWRWLILIDSDDLREKCALIIREHESRFLDILKETFTSGINSGEIKEQSFKALMHTYIVLIHGTLDGLMFYENFLERDEFINNVWSIFWEGIKVGKMGD